jgi:hypothetical protein
VKQIWTAVFGLAAGTAAIAGTIEPGAAPAIKVCVESSVLTPFVLIRGESIATQIFRNIGIGLSFVNRTKCAEPTSGSTTVLVSTGEPPRNFPGALAYTRIAERRSTVFFDRVEYTVEPLIVPSLLGHVLAHEIAHVVEGINRHSAEGVMKSHWDHDDYMRMYPNLLPFAPEDVKLIRAGMSAFMTLGVRPTTSAEW